MHVYVSDHYLTALRATWLREGVLERKRSWRIPARLRLARLWLYLALAELAG